MSVTGDWSAARNSSLNANGGRPEGMAAREVPLVGKPPRVAENGASGPVGRSPDSARAPKGMCVVCEGDLPLTT